MPSRASDDGWGSDKEFMQSPPQEGSPVGKTTHSRTAPTRCPLSHSTSISSNRVPKRRSKFDRQEDRMEDFTIIIQDNNISANRHEIEVPGRVLAKIADFLSVDTYEDHTFELFEALTGAIK